MPSSLLYITKLSASLALVWLLYQLLFRKLTFYRCNRWYLLGYTFLSFFIPLINIEPILESRPSGEPLVFQLIPTIGNYMGVLSSANRSATWKMNVWSGLLAVMVLGAVVLGIRLAIRWLSLRRVRRHAKLITDTDIRIYQVDANIIPFSFGNAIYINQRLHTEKEWEEIILHEYVHIRQQHTIDILLAELFCILNWYNPFVWLIRHSIRQNLEFIADSKVLEKGFDKKSYQYHLLKVIGETRYRLANNFNFSSLKKRIVMMNKIRSARLQLVKFLFILPLIAVLLVAFRDKYEGLFHRPGEDVINVAGIVVDVVTHQPLAGAIVVEQQSGLTTTADVRGFYRLRIPVNKDSVRIHIHFKKNGYGEDQNEFFFPSREIIMRNHGVIADALLLHDSDKYPYMMIAPFFGKIPDDPTYEDAQAALVQIIHNAEGMTKFANMRKAHPEVALFYSSEGNQRQVVILKSGEVEKYNFPGGPGLPEMEKKYGPLPEVMTERSTQVTAVYLDRWNAIGERAEKEFQSSNPDALHIIFPGDSRVIAVPRTGKPEIFDMMNDDPKERPSFEKLYGRLPDFIPATTISTHTGELAKPAVSSAPGTSAPGTSAPLTDTVPKKTVQKNTDASRKVPTVPAMVNLTAVGGHPLYILNSQRMPEGWKFDSIPADSIASVAVLKDEAAVALYGKAGANGVVQITTKDFMRSIPHLHPIDAMDSFHRPLLVVDGVITPWKNRDGMDGINPANIESIDILKGDSATNRFGDQAINGAILVHMGKKTSHMQPKVTINTKDGIVTFQADSISLPKAGITVTSSAGPR
jgi:TonB-dependent SusC/RagA subfamily outer membrane receptor